MANNLYTLGATNQAAAKSASRFIRDGVRNGGYSGLVEQNNSYTYTRPSIPGASSPQVALYTYSSSPDNHHTITDIQTGAVLDLTKIGISIPTIPFNPNFQGNFSTLVFLGTAPYMQGRGDS